ncbi:hypothetical protein TrVGV298_002405 [Trichoderma virens]|nr:hypothetical protein TrVGV298_002405 [Trichoderma virens]
MSQKDFESYDQGESLLSSNKVPCPAILLPVFEEAKHYIDAYFTTIHIAYPFIPESPFIEHYKTLRDHKSRNSNIETALSYTICAIGAYYRTLPGKDEAGDTLANFHHGTFTRSGFTPFGEMFLSPSFRVAQSIGLHIENEESDNIKSRHSPEIEKRRRVWYSIYVLDRLLSLQLGRPPAIHDDDFNVPLPSRASDAEIDWTGEVIEEKTSSSIALGDYFIAVIAFSEIVGRVLRSLYCPRRSHFASEDLLNTKDLDRQLVEWKLALPRALRFDLGHTFEQLQIFKRQASSFPPSR